MWHEGTGLRNPALGFFFISLKPIGKTTVRSE